MMKSGLAQHLKDRILSLLFIYSIGSSLNAALGERLSIFADAVTVSGSFLQSLFGGTIIPHAKDTMLLDPAAFNPTRLREAYGIHPDARVVMFLGSPGEHKGLDSLIEAVHELKDPNVMLFIVGIDESSPYCRHILEKAPRALGGNFVGIRMQPVDKIPEFIAMADVMAIPQKVSPASIGQVPSKVFDAMAMARPIVATSVSDLPEILNGCGWIVPPDNTRALAEVPSFFSGAESPVGAAGSSAKSSWARMVAPGPAPTRWIGPLPGAATILPRKVPAPRRMTCGRRPPLGAASRAACTVGKPPLPSASTVTSAPCAGATAPTSVAIRYRGKTKPRSLLAAGVRRGAACPADAMLEAGRVIRIVGFNCLRPRRCRRLRGGR